MTARDQSSPDTSQPASRLRVSTRLRRPVRVGGLVILAAALALLAGWTGLVIGMVVVVIGVMTPAPVAFGVGAVSLLVGTPVTPLGGSLAAVGLFAVLVDPAVGAKAGQRVIATTAFVAGVLSGVAYGLDTVWSLPAVTIALAGTVALILYALHRYERVRLGLVSDTPDQ